MYPIDPKYQIGSRGQHFLQRAQVSLMVGANRFTEQEQGCRAEIVIQRIPAVEGQRDLLGRRGPEIAQNAPEISYDTAAINHGPHASARAVMAQQIPHQEEAQVSLQDGVEQIDVDRQYCVAKGADRGGEDNEEEKQGQLSARAGVCDPLQKGSRQIDPHHRIDEPHVVALAAVQQGGEKGIKGNRHSCAQGIGKQIDQVPGA